MTEKTIEKTTEKVKLFNDRIQFSLWDIFKCIFVIFIMIVIYTKGSAFVDKMFHKSDQTQMTEAQITSIASNLIMLQNQANKERFDALMKEMKASEARYTNAADDKIRNALQAATDYAKANGAKITTLGQTMAQMNTSFKETIASIVYKDPEKPSRSYEDYDLKREMSDGTEMPEGWVKYHPDWPGDDKLVQYHYPLDYYTKIIRSQKKDGTFAYHTESWVQNDFVKSSRGIKYPLTLKKVQFEERPLTDKSWSFNPRLGLGAGFTSAALFPSLDLSLFSYGRTDVDMDWRFLVIGAGIAGWGENTDSTFIGSFTPLQYNIGTFAPFIKNFFVGPTISIDTESNTGYGATFSIPF